MDDMLWFCNCPSVTALHANYCTYLVRTDTDGTKHGIVLIGEDPVFNCRPGIRRDGFKLWFYDL